MSHGTSHQIPTGQQGMAILLVLGIVAAMSLLAIHTIAISETIARESAVNAMSASLKFQVESAADVAFWMHLTDRRLFSDRTLGNSLEDREVYTDMEPWMLDAREHQLDDNCSVYLNDAIKSISVDTLQNIKNTIDSDDTEAVEAADTFIDIYQDYTDTNSLVNLLGMEADEFAADGQPTLPRNDTMQFKEELYWLPNWNNVITGDITIIPPTGFSFSSNSSSNSRQRNSNTASTQSSKPNFFTCTEDTIRTTLTQNALSISDKDIQTVIDARTAWTRDAVPLSESIGDELIITVKNCFSFTESGYAEILATATGYDGAVTVTRRVTRDAKSSSSSFTSDNNKQTLSVWEVRNH